MSYIIVQFVYIVFCDETIFSICGYLRLP